MSLNLKIVLSLTIMSLAMAYGIVGGFCEGGNKADESTLEIIQAYEKTHGVKEAVLSEPQAEEVLLSDWEIEEVLKYERPYVPKEQEESEKVVTYTEDDLFCLSAVIYAEAGADYLSDELRMAVGNVVLNRVTSKYYPNSIREVIEQPMQYGWLSRDGIAFPENAEENAVTRAYDCARRLLEGERVLPDNVIFQAEFVQGEGVYTTIDGVYFCWKGGCK